MMSYAATAKSPFWAALFPYVLLIGAVLLAYSNVYHNQFLYDDDLLIVHNQFLRSWSNLPSLFVTVLQAGANASGRYYRPLQALLYLIVFQMAGLSTVAFHVLNLLFHTANACLVYVLGRKLNFKPAAVLMAALVWALHPLQTEAVAYNSATADTVYVFFMLLGIIALLPDFAPRRYVVVVPLVLLGLLCKESAIVFPLLAMSCLYLKTDSRCRLGTYWGVWPTFVLVGLYVVLRMLIVPHGAPQGLIHATSSNVEASFTPFASLPLYVRLMLWPVGLHIGHDVPSYSSPLHLPVLIGFAMMVAAALQILKPQTSQSLPLSWGLLWFAAALLPIFDVQNLAYEHWLYLPMIGLLLGAAQSMALYVENNNFFVTGAQRKMASGVMIIFSFVLGAMTYRQNTVWHDSVSLFSAAIKSGEVATKAHINLGGYYAQHGAYDKAMAEFAEAEKNDGDTLPDLEHNIGITMMMQNNNEMNAAALAHFERALIDDPDFFPTLNLLADYYDAAGNQAAALVYRAKADDVRRRNQTLAITTTQP